MSSLNQVASVIYKKFTFQKLSACLHSHKLALSGVCEDI